MAGPLFHSPPRDYMCAQTHIVARRAQFLRRQNKRKECLIDAWNLSDEQAKMNRGTHFYKRLHVYIYCVERHTRALDACSRHKMKEAKGNRGDDIRGANADAANCIYANTLFCDSFRTFACVRGSNKHACEYAAKNTAPLFSSWRWW